MRIFADQGQVHFYAFAHYGSIADLSTKTIQKSALGAAVQI